MALKRKKVSSSAIAEIGYDKNEALLQIKFNSGKVYNYINVPELTYQNFINAKSIGTFFTQNIKDNFSFKLAD